MVSIVVPLPVTVGILKTQALSEGRPVQAKVVAALKPFEPATVTIVEADWPGLATAIAEGAAEMMKSGFVVTLIVIAGVVDAV